MNRFWKKIITLLLPALLHQQLSIFIMQFFAVVLALMVAGLNASFIPASTLIRTPSHDSAIIRSDRLGGNFAYSVQEGHAYAAITPIVQHVAEPVAVSYHAPAIAAAPYAPYALPYGLQYSAPLLAAAHPTTAYYEPAEHRL